MDVSPSYPNIYKSYLNHSCPTLDPEIVEAMVERLNDVRWDEPESPADFNAIAVLSLIMAEQEQDPEMRMLYGETAFENLQEVATSYPLATAHLALLQGMIGDTESATQAAFSLLLNVAQFNDTEQPPLESGLVYVPPDKGKFSVARVEVLQHLLTLESGYQQTLVLCVEVLRRSQLVFYNTGGLRFFQLATHYLPNSSAIHLGLGLAQLFNYSWEGIVHLHRARTLNPEHAAVQQALYLAYQALEQPDRANYWLRSAQLKHQEHPNHPAWQWATLPYGHPFTYVPFDDDLLMAVEANYRSIVTSVLIVEGDWFEAEMELWRTQITPGMTVIDVGANVGVYTVSAARQVGPTGRVVAVEPFPGCIQCLEETKRINQLSWVTICEGAASDHEGFAHLSLQASSELNEIVTDTASLSSDAVVDVACFTLDGLAERENLDRVDWLKIDAEGHEMQVLKGGDRILQEFKPRILYENIAGSQGSNVEVGKYLQSLGYQLFAYQPFVQQLQQVASLDSVRQNLNIIALPPMS